MDHLSEVAVRGVARRVLGDRAAQHVDFEIEPGSKRAYSYDWVDDRLRIRASDPVSACVGLRSYLRRELGRDVQWGTVLPHDLATDLQPCSPHSGAARVSEQYMYNFCTYSYSTTYWDWADWERELDWMALHGITMPLALVGHEAVLAETWQRLGVPAHEALKFLGDPVFSAFQFMGCLDGDEAVVTPDWLDTRLDLGRRILDRCRALGMKPVLPAFTGHVPTGWADESAGLRDWHGNATRFLDPNDDRFRRVAATLAEVQRELLGDAKYFAADPFIETIPIDDSTDFPALVGRRILDGITDVVHDAVWVLQAWPFSYQRDYWTDERIAAFLGGIDDDQLLVLDLWAESEPVWPITGGFGGKNWHWCGLLNFGGRSDAIGDLPRAITQFESALSSANPPSGVGLTMESFHNNAVFFELLCDLAWESVADLPAWIARFAAHRYGTEDVRTGQGWIALLHTLYDADGRQIRPDVFHGVLANRADLLAARDSTSLRARTASLNWFDPQQLLDGWRSLTELIEEFPELSSGPLGLDLIEIAQAAGIRIVDERCARVLDAPDSAARQHEVARLLAVADDLDAVLATRSESRLSTAEAQAATGAGPDGDAGRLVAGQRRILTSWNAAPGTILDDYSGRIWHGLVGGYYRERLAAWARSIDSGDGAERLGVEFDRLCASFIADGGHERERPLSELSPTLRTLQHQYAAAFNLSGAGRPDERKLNHGK